MERQGRQSDLPRITAVPPPMDSQRTLLVAVSPDTPTDNLLLRQQQSYFPQSQFMRVLPSEMPVLPSEVSPYCLASGISVGSNISLGDGILICTRLEERLCQSLHDPFASNVVANLH